MPFYLPDHDEFVAHVHGVVVGLDLEHARRPQAGVEVGMSRFVNHLATFVGKAGVAYEFRREREPHREEALERECRTQVILNVSNFCQQNSLLRSLRATEFAGLTKEAAVRSIGIEVIWTWGREE